MTTFAEWLEGLNAAAATLGYAGADRFWQSSGAECWSDSYEDGMSPMDALIADETYA